MNTIIAPALKISTKTEQFCEMGKAVVLTEMKAIAALVPRIDHRFTEACQQLLVCRGRIIVMGMGKSGHIGNKIAATLASTGSPAFFVHPGEAGHGDMGMITRDDSILALSNSGETPEILNLLPLIKRLGVGLIVLTGNPQSTLAQMATTYLDTSVEQEACPLGLAPTSSTTAALVMGDALAIALLEARGFTPEDFARFHPGGTLGTQLRRKLLRIQDIMHTGTAIPMVTKDCLLKEALIEMTRKRLGMTVIVDAAHHILGIFTDGDLRRTLDSNHDCYNTPIEAVMTKHCVTIAPNLLIAEAVERMETHNITTLLVTNHQHQLLGVVHMHDLLKVGVI